MKAFRIILMALSLLFSMAAFPAYADDKNPPSTGYDDGELKPCPNPPKDFRPRTPSRQQIFCTLTEECLTVSFTIPEGECTIFIQDENSGNYIAETFDSEEMFVSFNTEGIRSCQITLTTELGNTYVGSLSIEK